MQSILHTTPLIVFHAYPTLAQVRLFLPGLRGGVADDPDDLASYPDRGNPAASGGQRPAPCRSRLRDCMHMGYTSLHRWQAVAQYITCPIPVS